MTSDQANDAMQQAIDDDNVNGDNAYVESWDGAAESMCEGAGFSCDATYNADGEHQMLAEDHDNNPNDAEHFVNDNGDGTYHDPANGGTGTVGDTPLQEGGLGPTRGLDIESTTCAN